MLYICSEERKKVIGSNCCPYAFVINRMWREIRLLAASKPVIASMSDVAASGGYYMAMAAQTIVAENLTLTGSIGVVTGNGIMLQVHKIKQEVYFSVTSRDF